MHSFFWKQDWPHHLGSLGQNENAATLVQKWLRILWQWQQSMRASVDPSKCRAGMPPQVACPRSQHHVKIQRSWHSGPYSSDSNQWEPNGSCPFKMEPACLQSSQPPSLPFSPTLRSSVSQHSSLHLLNWFFSPWLHCAIYTTCLAPAEIQVCALWSQGYNCPHKDMLTVPHRGQWPTMRLLLLIESRSHPHTGWTTLFVLRQSS